LVENVSQAARVPDWYPVWHHRTRPADEPWGVRRFYVRAPFGKLVNILAHAHGE